MASFKKLKEASLVERRYLKKAIVYLESEDDVQVFRDRWFIDKGENLEFIGADAVAQGGTGGCTQVIKTVDEDRKNGIKAFGIVDRDALLRCCRLEEFFEANDASFGAAKPFGEHVFVLRKWEMENYLLHPDAVETYLADAQKRSKRTLDKTTTEILDCASIMMPLLAANVLLQLLGTTALPHKFEVKSSTAKAIAHKIEDHLRERDLNCRPWSRIRPLRGLNF